jgi:hypothetical protein
MEAEVEDRVEAHTIHPIRIWVDLVVLAAEVEVELQLQTALTQPATDQVAEVEALIQEDVEAMGLRVL